jgi:hypothetical protein
MKPKLANQHNYDDYVPICMIIHGFDDLYDNMKVHLGRLVGFSG